MNIGWIKELNALEDRERLVVEAVSKDEVENCIERKLTDDEWRHIRRLYHKIDRTQMIDQLCELAREIAQK